MNNHYCFKYDTILTLASKHGWLPLKRSPVARLLAGLLLGLSLVAASSCKPHPNTDSQTASLDNMTRVNGQPLKANSCGVNVTDSFLSGLPPADRAKLSHFVANGSPNLNVAIGAFLAVPKPLQTLFFGANGRLVLVKTLPANCTANMSTAARAFAENGGGTANTCWGMVNGHIEILLRDDPAVIHQALVRSFGYLYTHYFAVRLTALGSTAALPAALNTQATSGLQRLARQGEDLGNALLADMAARGTDQKLLNLSTAATNQPGEYAATVIAETIDSYYCSAATRAVFAQQFPHTYATFNDGPMALRLDLGEPFVAPGL